MGKKLGEKGWRTFWLFTALIVAAFTYDFMATGWWYGWLFILPAVIGGQWAIAKFGNEQ